MGRDEVEFAEVEGEVVVEVVERGDERVREAGGLGSLRRIDEGEGNRNEGIFGGLEREGEVNTNAPEKCFFFFSFFPLRERATETFDLFGIDMRLRFILLWFIQTN